jgi:hypothetical protein
LVELLGGKWKVEGGRLKAESEMRKRGGGRRKKEGVRREAKGSRRRAESGRHCSCLFPLFFYSCFTFSEQNNTNSKRRVKEMPIKSCIFLESAGCNFVRTI